MNAAAHTAAMAVQEDSLEVGTGEALLAHISAVKTEVAVAEGFQL